MSYNKNKPIVKVETEEKKEEKKAVSTKKATVKKKGTTKMVKENLDFLMEKDPEVAKAIELENLMLEMY